MHSSESERSINYNFRWAKFLTRKILEKKFRIKWKIVSSTLTWFYFNFKFFSIFLEIFIFIGMWEKFRNRIWGVFAKGSMKYLKSFLNGTDFPSITVQNWIKTSWKSNKKLNRMEIIWDTLWKISNISPNICIQKIFVPKKNKMKIWKFSNFEFIKYKFSFLISTIPNIKPLPFYLCKFISLIFFGGISQGSFYIDFLHKLNKLDF